MKKDSSFFDEHYYETPLNGAHKGNYTRAGGYRQHASTNVDWAAKAQHLLRLYPKAKYILDIGCAYGHLVDALRNEGVEAYGADFSEYALSQAAESVKPYLIQHDIAEGLPGIPGEHPRRKWDLVTSFDVLEHAESAEEVEELLTLFLQRAKRQYHLVNTGQYPEQCWGGDLSHGVKMTLNEWQEIADKVSRSIVIVEL